jgi:hypothetical protein
MVTENRYYLGIDQGYTKTSLALLSPEKEVIHVDEERTWFDNCSATRRANAILLQQRYSERLQKLLGRLQISVEAPVNVYFSTNGDLPEQEVYSLFNQKRLVVASFEQFSDVHSHYGLTNMPGRCIMYVCGSYYNLMYYDKNNNVTCLQGRYWDATSWGSGLCAYCLGNFILDVYAESCLSCSNNQLIRAVERQLGIMRGNKTVYDYIQMLRLHYDKGCVMKLAQLVSQFINHPQIARYLEREIEKSLLAVRLLGEHAGDPDVRTVFLGGGVFTNNEILVDAFKQRAPNISIECVKGYPALGAVYFRLRNPNAEIATWQPKEVTSGNQYK